MADKRDILIRLLGEETVSRMAGKAGDGLDKFGDKLDATERDAKDLDRQIGEVEADLKALAVAFSRTSDAADRMDITKAMRKQQAELRKLTKAKDLLPDFGKQGEEAASGFATSFSARLGPLLAKAPGAGAAGAAIGLAMAPAVSAAVAGAVVGAAGIGGVLGGVILASRDPQVKAAGASLGQHILGDLEHRAAGFVPVMLGNIDKVGKAWGELGPDLDRIFASSRLVDPLVNGMVSGAKKIVHGFADAVDQADPVIRSLSRSFDAISGSVGDVFTKLAGDADEGASAIDDLTNSVTHFIEATGAIVHAGAVVKGWSNQVDIAVDKGRYWVEDFISNGPRFKAFGWQLDLTADGFKRGTKEAEAYRRAGVGTATVADFATLKLAGMSDAQIASADASGTYRSKLDEVNNALGRTGTAATTAAVEIKTWADIVRESTDRAISAENANIRLEQAIDDAGRAAKEGADKGIDPNTEAGRKNRLALLGVAEAAKAASSDILKNGGSHEMATAATERGRKKFLEAAKAMGVEKGEAILLANKLFGIPNVDRTVSVATGKAQAAIAAVQAGLGKIHSKNVTVGVYYKSNGDLKLPGGTSLKGAASGGPVTGSGPKGVDSVPMVLAPGEHVLTAREVDAAGGHAGVERLRAMLRGGATGVPAMAGAGARTGGGAGVVNLYATFNVNVPPTANLAEVGRQNALALDAWARNNGIRWRAAS